MMAQPVNNPFAAPPSNPFGVATKAPPINNPFKSAPTTQNTNVFGTPTAPNPAQVQPAKNVFGAPQPVNPFFANPVNGAPSASKPSSVGSNNTFGAPSSQPPVFGARAPTSKVPSPPNRFGEPKGGKPSATSNSVQSTFGKPKDVPQKTSIFGRAPRLPESQVAKPFPNLKGKGKSPAAQTNGQLTAPANRERDGQPGRALIKKGPTREPTREPTQRTKELSPFAFEFANNLINHLRKENIKPPNWPPDPGNPDKRGAADNLKAMYRKYRTRVYASLRKVDLIDDPDKRRRLEDALPFKGICEDMCPEFERIARISEQDTKPEERAKQDDGRMWPEPSLMVKKFGRSAAGQDAPLPMDVRSVDALRRTTDYLFRDLLQSEDNLPAMHNFLWDRTRAIRRDFTFHSQKSRKEMADLVYVFETITRFHAASLNLLSRKGFGNDDFEARQEIEQLGKTILSLIQAYDICQEMKVVCENEPEFRAYYLILNVFDPSVRKRIREWGRAYWFNSKEVQTALALIEAMDNVRESKGSIKPHWLPSLSNTAFNNYFSIVEDPNVSYTMACIAAVHFNEVRKNILKNLIKSYSRPRDAPRTISASDLNKLLRFDTPEEAVKFIELQGLEMSSWAPDGKPPPPEPYLFLNKREKKIKGANAKHAYSWQLVERKRGTQSLPHAIFNTVYEEIKPQEAKADGDVSPDELFVTQPKTLEHVPAVISPTKVTKTPTLTSSTPISTSVFGQGTPTVGSAPGFQTVFGSLTSNTPAAPIPNFTTPDTAPSPFSFLTQQPTSNTVAAPVISQAITSKPAPIFGEPAQPLQSTPTPPTSPFSTFKPSTNSLEAIAQGVPGTPQYSQKAASFLPAPAAADGKTAQTSLTPVTGASDSASAIKPPLNGAVPATSGLPSPGNSSPSSAPAGTPPKIKRNPFGHDPEDEQGTRLPTPSVQVTPPSAADAPSFAKQQEAAGVIPTLPKPSLGFGLGQLGLPPPQPAQKVQQSAPIQQPPTVQAPPPVQPATPKRDLMGDFSKWYVMGDRGLASDFTEHTVESLLSDVFAQWQQEQVDKKRKEEDDQSWEAARKHLAYRLSVKYFYKWQEIARKLATKRILRAGKEKMRAYRDHERALAKKKKEEMEKAAAAERRATRRRIAADGERLRVMATSERLSNTEEDLLASGIFSGLRDARGAARNVVRETPDVEWRVSTSTFSPDHAESEESELELEPPRRSLIAARESAQSPESIEKTDGWKTRSLRGKFGLQSKRSVSVTSSVNRSLSGFRQSLPGSTLRTTNFSRKRSASESDEEREPKRKTLSKTNGFKSRHWDLRARGFVPLPNGDWATESIAKSVKNDKRGSGRGEEYSLVSDVDPAEVQIRDDESLGSGATNDDNQDGVMARFRERLARLKKPRAHHSVSGYELGSPQSGSRSVLSVSPSPAPKDGSTTSKRKRDAGDDGAESDYSPSTKKSHVITKEETDAKVREMWRALRELQEDMDRCDQDQPLMQQQMEMNMLGNPS